MRWNIFSYFQDLEVKQVLSTKLEGILNELHQISNAASQIRIESILLEEIRQQSNAASQIRNEISNTLYFFLIGVTIVGAGVIGLLSLYFQYKAKPSFSLYTIEFFLMATLVFSGIVCILFIERLLELTNEQARYLESVNELKNFFSERLEVQGINKKLLNIEGNLDSFKHIPTYIRYIIIPIASLSFCSATYIFTGFISFQLASRFSFPTTSAFAITVFFSVFVFGLCFFLLQRRYR